MRVVDVSAATRGTYLQQYQLPPRRFTRQRHCLAQGRVGIFSLTDRGDIEVGLVDRHLLNGGTGAGDDLHDAGRLFPICVHAGADEAAVRTEALGRDAGHGGADAELAGLVASRTDDTLSLIHI